MNFFIDKFNISIEKISDNFLSKIFYGELVVIFPSGKKLAYKAHKPGFFAELHIHNYQFFSKIFKNGSLGFADAYIQGDFSSPNLTNLLLFSFQNEKHFLKNLKINWLNSSYRKLRHYLNENTKYQSKKNIKYHYDLGNDFYEKWLDESMTYSSAFFQTEKENLCEAQINKYKIIADSVSLNENSNTLEIGCGWGGFSTYVAKNYGCKVDAITISKEQFEFTSKKIQDEGLNEKVSVKFKDYRDINKKYSNIVSIEMFEAVGKKYWTKYFEKLKNSLFDNGVAALQIITIDEYRAKNYHQKPDFIQQYIFPGGMLPTKPQIKDITKQLNLTCSEIVRFGNSYAKTLNLWNNRFQSSWDELSKMGFSLKFKRMWEYYLSYCETGFLCRSTDVSHFIIRK